MAPPADAASVVPTQALKEMLRRQFECLSDTPELGVLKRVLELTFLKPMRSQQAVADALNMSWSTYRRRLADAVGVLTAQLWEAETALAAAQAKRASVAAETPYEEFDSQTMVVPRRSRYLSRVAVGILALAVLAVIIGLLLPTIRSHEAAALKASAGPANGQATLAVLPFLNMNQDPTVQHLSDGLTDELINRLGRVPNL
ncbi:MAG: hypothetical protein ACRES7_11715, partial [Gammaproteobacteria bacterium]